MKTFIKFINKANMWVHSSLSYSKEKIVEDQKWFCTRKEAEEYEEEIKKNPTKDKIV